MCVFWISRKRADQFPWNFLWFIGVTGRRVTPMCTGHERWTAQWPAVRAHACTLADLGTGQSRAGLGAWPETFDAGPSQRLLCSWVQFSGPTSRPPFGWVNAKYVSLSEDSHYLVQSGCVWSMSKPLDVYKQSVHLMIDDVICYCSALVYLNSDFVGGNFFFTHQNMSLQVGHSCSVVFI